MPGHHATKRTCGAILRSRPWDAEGCKRRALVSSDRCVQHAGPKTEAGRAKTLEALARGRKTAVKTIKRKAALRRKAKIAAKDWTRDFGQHGVKENTGELDTVGTFARSIDDIALFRSGLLRLKNNPLNAPSISELRIGFCRTPLWHELEPSSQELLEGAASKLAKAGANIEDFKIDEVAFTKSRNANKIAKGYSMNRAWAWEISNQYELISDILKQTHLKGVAEITHDQWREAIGINDNYRRQFSEEIKDYDIMLTASSVGEGQGTLLTLIGGPDAGRVDWHPSVIAAAAETGLSRSEAGDLEVTA